MKVNWYAIKMFVLLGLCVFLFAFSHKRNQTRKVEHVEVNFEAGHNLFITTEAVNKLLTQNNQEVTGRDKEILILKDLEKRLDANPMIANAEVYLTLNGILGANVRQRRPLARVQAAQSYYLDDTGEIMPLSSVYSARVPIVNGLSKDQVAEVYPLLLLMRDDAVLKKQIVGISRDRDGHYVLKPRIMKYEIQLGRLDRLQEKVSNYKAFYGKAVKDKSLETYATVDLRFKGQVVGVKK